jgi:Fic family protein
MRGVRGAEKLPGEVRRSQNWIGGSRPGNAAYVPPPPHALGYVLGAFEKLLTKPLLYLSLFFKRHRDDYYRRLTAVRIEGDWEGWLDFFLDGVATIADEAVASARELFALVASDRTRALGHGGMSIIALRLFEILPRHPVVTVNSVMKLMETTKGAAPLRRARQEQSRSLDEPQLRARRRQRVGDLALGVA